VYTTYIWYMAKKLNRLGDILKEQGITAYRLAKDSGIGYQLISAYVKNTRQPSMETLFKIAKTLSINPRELINS
jgi:putative transcriptional regulator